MCIKCNISKLQLAHLKYEKMNFIFKGAEQKIHKNILITKIGNFLQRRIFLFAFQ